jgi:cytochrome oxidase Cu insertion factor (SCO1/SenC/PrrC family)
VNIGEAAPLTPLVDARGRPTTLAELRGRATLLVFLRHLG